MARKRFRIVLIFTFIIFVPLLAGIGQSDWFSRGHYFGGGLFYFHDEISYWHEKGHAELDRLNINIDDFSFMLEKYINENKDNPNSDLISYLLLFPGINNNPRLEDEFNKDGWGGYREAYVEIYRLWKMDVIELPEEFYPFYDIGE